MRRYDNNLIFRFYRLVLFVFVIKNYDSKIKWYKEDFFEFKNNDDSNEIIMKMKIVVIDVNLRSYF